MDGTGSSSSSGSAAVFCRECVLSLKQASGSVFCSARCYDANFQHHRDGVHLPGRREKARGRGGGGQLPKEKAAGWLRPYEVGASSSTRNPINKDNIIYFNYHYYSIDFCLKS